jgi:outer membrane lipoprotein SlyB
MFAVSVASAGDVFIYPNKGQSNEQMEKDRTECYRWAKQNTGFDPMAAPTATSAPPPRQQTTASAGRGALGGALLGGVVGSTSGDFGKGAAVGAVAGGLFGGLRKSSQQKAADQQQREWEQQQAAQYQARREDYNRAYGACLEGRGYTVR